MFQGSESITENVGKFTPYGLTSIDAANSIVLRSIAEKDWEAMADNLRILAYTPGDIELIELADNHIKETLQRCEAMKLRQNNYVMADKFAIGVNRIAYLKDRNFELYRLLRVKMKAKGYLEWNKLLGTKEFEILEGSGKQEEEE